MTTINQCFKHFKVTFDNSSANPANPDPSKPVMWGDQTDEEMAVAFAFVSIPRKPQASESPQTRRDTPELRSKAQVFVDEYFRKHDTDENGVVSRDELPPAVRENGFWTLDLNRNGELSKEEIRRRALNHFRKKQTVNH